MSLRELFLSSTGWGETSIPITCEAYATAESYCDLRLLENDIGMRLTAAGGEDDCGAQNECAA